ncbi:MAG: hypothetical protein MSS25_07395 [Erysipelatoclostridium ramosum]|nr:hypothetical protein [Thomasclavelia ramosa]
MSMISNMFLKKKQDKNNAIKSNLIELQTGYKCSKDASEMIEQTLKLIREDNLPLSIHSNVSKKKNTNYQNNDFANSEVIITLGKETKQRTITNNANYNFLKKTQEKDIWIAYLKGHEEIWGCGKTRIDAIQDLEKSIAYEKTTRN